MRRRGVIAVSMVVAVAGPSYAAAQPELSDDPAELMQQGYALRDRGDDGAALPYFERAYELSPTPTTAALLGLAQAAVQDWRGAIEHLSRALEAEGDPWVEQSRTELERVLALARERAPEVSAAGTEPAVPTPARAIEAEPEPAAAATVLEPEPAERTQAPPAEDGGTLWPWIAGGAAIAALGAAAALWLSAEAEFDELTDDCKTMRCTDRDVAAGRRLDALTNVALGVGVAAGIAAVVLFVLEADGGGGEEAVAVGVGPGSVQVSGSF